MKQLILASLVSVSLVGCGNDQASITADMSAQQSAQVALGAFAFDKVHLHGNDYLTLPGRIVVYSYRPARDGFIDRFVVNADMPFVALEARLTKQLETLGYNKREVRNDDNRLVVRYTLENQPMLTADFRPNSENANATELFLTRPAVN